MVTKKKPSSRTTESSAPATKKRAAARKKEPAPADPDKLVRERAGAYKTADGRFTVESEASGAWFVVDAEQPDELGMPRVIGPHATLAEAKDAIVNARSSPPMGSLLKARAGRGKTTRRRAGDTSEDAGDADAAEPEPAPPKPPQIRYATTTHGIEQRHLMGGFWKDWPDPPSPRMHLRILEAADEIVLAIDADTKNVVGFITALTDDIQSAYLPLLEVLPDYRRRGIGSELVKRLLARLGELYMVDLVTDPELVPFFERFGLSRSTGMSRRGRPG